MSPNRLLGVTHEDDLRRARSLFVWRFVALLMALAQIASVVLIVMLLNRNADFTARVLDCIDPDGTCYAEGSARARLLANVSTFAAACADLPGVQSADEIKACIEEKLAAASD